MSRFLYSALASTLLAISAPAWAQSTSASANLSITIAQSQAISGVNLSNNSFAGGAGSGTVVGAISVTMSPSAPPFSGTLSLSGTNASSFQIVGSNLETTGVVPAGAYQINIVAVQPGASDSPFTQAETITGTNPASTCPQGDAYPADGCAGAQANGSVQHTNFFTGYTNGAGYAPRSGCNVGGYCRPPWNVAGVDYPVGYSGTLADPVQGGLPSCATLSGSGSGPYSVSVSGNCTISGFDFSLHNGICVTVMGSGNVTLSNNKFAWGTNCNGGGSHIVTVDNTAGAVTIKYNEFDGGQSTSDNLGNLIGDSSGTSTVTVNVEYNALLDTDQADIQPTGPGKVWNITYNYVENVGCCGNHGDFTIPNNGSGTLTVNDNYNTVYGHAATATTLCYITAANTGGTVTGTCNNETLIGNPGGSITVSYLVEISAGTLGNWSINNNYMDSNGSYGFFTTMPGYVLSGTITCTGNINLNTGGKATGTLGGATCN
jgi:hypothetical protein